MTDSSAIRQSVVRLQKARDALKRLEATSTLDETESAWADLLLSGNAIYSKLEQGAKAGGGKASAWYGRIKKLRKDDPLLSYVHHARNSEEHGIEDVTKRMKAGDATLTFREPFDPGKMHGLQLNIGADSRGHVRVSSSNEDVVSTRMYDQPSLALVRVKDSRFGDYFDPPYEHLGTKLADQSPLTVGSLFVAYLAQLIDDARPFGV
ncbi:MAG TPA: hypothetical protein VMV19_07880 [Xanthobacteraceae bacterium]|nr:hypothetical protein [Xanthobacteraceae bacterium]